MREIIKEAETGEKSMRTANTALAHWTHDQGALIAWRYSANAIFRFSREGKHYFLRLSDNDLRSREWIEAELHFLDTLRTTGFPAVASVPNDEGQRIVTIETDYATWHAVVFEAAPGKPLEAEELSDDQVQAWGQTVAQMHMLSAELTSGKALARPDWHDIMAITRRFLGEGEVNAHRFLDEAEVWLQSLPLDAQNYGLIHWDFEPDNIAWDGLSPMVYDFDGCAYFWFTADIAFAFDDVLALPYTQREQVLASFIEGYRSVRPLSQAWVDRIPLFVRLMRVLKHATLVYAWRDVDPALDLPWMADIRNRHAEAKVQWRERFASPFIPSDDADFAEMYLL